MTARKQVWLEDVGGGDGVLHRADPAVDWVENHLHYKDLDGQNRILIGQGTPGTLTPPIALQIPEKTFVARKPGFDIKALRVDEIQEMLGMWYEDQGILPTPETAIPIINLIQTQGAHANYDLEDLYFWDTERSRWLGVTTHRFLWGRSPSSPTAAGYLDHPVAGEGSAGLGYKLKGEWVCVGAEINQGAPFQTTTVELRATGGTQTGTEITLSGAGNTEYAFDKKISATNAILSAYATTTTPVGGVSVTYLLRRLLE